MYRCSMQCRFGSCRSNTKPTHTHTKRYHRGNEKNKNGLQLKNKTGVKERHETRKEEIYSEGVKIVEVGQVVRSHASEGRVEREDETGGMDGIGKICGRWSQKNSTLAVLQQGGGGSWVGASNRQTGGKTGRSGLVPGAQDQFRLRLRASCPLFMAVCYLFRTRAVLFFGRKDPCACAVRRDPAKTIPFQAGKLRQWLGLLPVNTTSILSPSKSLLAYKNLPTDITSAADRMVESRYPLEWIWGRHGNRMAVL